MDDGDSVRGTFLIRLTGGHGADTRVLSQPDFTPSKATNDAKDKFVKTIFGFVFFSSGATLRY